MNIKFIWNCAKNLGHWWAQTPEVTELIERLGDRAERAGLEDIAAVLVAERQARQRELEEGCPSLRLQRGIWFSDGLSATRDSWSHVSADPFKNIAYGRVRLEAYSANYPDERHRGRVEAVIDRPAGWAIRYIRKGRHEAVEVHDRCLASHRDAWFDWFGWLGRDPDEWSPACSVHDALVWALHEGDDEHVEEFIASQGFGFREWERILREARREAGYRQQEDA
jgi:hypothetical protein